MSLTTEQTPINISSTIVSDELFYSIIDRLKVQKALPADSFVKQMPFFNFCSVSKESQVKELFQDISDPAMYKSLFKNILTLPDQNNNDLLSKRLSSMQVMGFAQIVLYKVLPCCDENCPNRPREVATRNQYKDYEYECPFYHHDKDQRRLVLEPSIEEEFVYKANYCEEKNPQTSEKDKHSQNYFESLYHPLYYKMFRCKREHCNFSQFCPYFHSEEEKKAWDRTFGNFIRKDRVSYVKDKQKYFGQKQNYKNQGNKIVRAGSDSQPNNSENSNIYRQNNKYKTQKSQEIPNTQNKGSWRSEKALTPVSKDFDNQRNPLHKRKSSGASSDSNSSPINFTKYYDNKENMNIKRAC